jgi:hypothetical protein
MLVVADRGAADIVDDHAAMGVAVDPSFGVVRRERREPELGPSGQPIEKCDESQIPQRQRVND